MKDHFKKKKKNEADCYMQFSSVIGKAESRAPLSHDRPRWRLKLNCLLANLEKWMKTYDGICKILGFLSELMSLSMEQIEDEAKNLISL